VLKKTETTKAKAYLALQKYVNIMYVYIDKHTIHLANSAGALFGYAENVTLPKVVKRDLQI